MKNWIVVLMEARVYPVKYCEIICAAKEILIEVASLVSTYAVNHDLMCMTLECSSVPCDADLIPFVSSCCMISPCLSYY